MLPPPLTLADLQTVHRWRTTPKPNRLTWVEIGERMGRNHFRLNYAYTAWLRGDWTPADRAGREAARAAALEEAVRSGCTSIGALAARFGMTRPAMSMALARIGLDHEMRLELAPAGTAEALRAAHRERVRAMPRKGSRWVSGTPSAGPVKPVAPSAHI